MAQQCCWSRYFRASKLVQLCMKAAPPFRRGVRRETHIVALHLTTAGEVPRTIKTEANIHWQPGSLLSVTLARELLLLFVAHRWPKKLPSNGEKGLKSGQRGTQGENRGRNRSFTEATVDCPPPEKPLSKFPGHSGCWMAYTPTWSAQGQPPLQIALSPLSNSNCYAEGYPTHHERCCDICFLRLYGMSSTVFILLSLRVYM